MCILLGPDLSLLCLQLQRCFLPLGTGQRQRQIMEDKFVISEQLLLLIPRVGFSPEADRKRIGMSYYFGVKLLT